MLILGALLLVPALGAIATLVAARLWPGLPMWRSALIGSAPLPVLSAGVSLVGLVIGIVTPASQCVDHNCYAARLLGIVGLIGAAVLFAASWLAAVFALWLARHLRRDTAPDDTFD